MDTKSFNLFRDYSSSCIFSVNFSVLSRSSLSSGFKPFVPRFTIDVAAANTASHSKKLRHKTAAAIVGGHASAICPWHNSPAARARRLTLHPCHQAALAKDMLARQLQRDIQRIQAYGALSVCAFGRLHVLAKWAFPKHRRRESGAQPLEVGPARAQFDGGIHDDKRLYAANKSVVVKVLHPENCGKKLKPSSANAFNQA